MYNKLVSFFISIYIWVFIVLTIIPLFLLYGFIWIMVLPFDHRRVVTHYYTVLWTRLYLTINPGWRIRVEYRERIASSISYVLVSNHQSIIDIALLLQLRINFKWVSKMELARVPFVGWVIWMNNHILVRRGDKQSVAQMAEACKKTLSEGTSVFMFPEGTRTGNGELQAFKEGAFILAKDAGVPILPVILDGANKALPRKGFWFRANQIFTVRVLEVIPAETVNRLDLNQLVDHTRNEMAEELRVLRSTPLV